MGNNKFEWTPELVAEFYDWLVGRSGSGLAVSLMAEFKKSKEPVPEWEIIEVARISDNQKLSCLYVQGMKIRLDHYRIYTIRRLSDGEKFSIGDKLTSHSTCITDIELDDKYGGGIKLSLGLHGITCSIHGVIKEKEPELQWFVIPHSNLIDGRNKGWTPVKQEKANMGGYADCQYFPDEESAHAFIINNKPCLSVKEINDLFTKRTGYGMGIENFLHLKELVRSKL